MSQEEVLQDNAAIEPEDPESVQKLKMLVHSLKKKYGEAVTQSYSLEQKTRDLSAENSTLKQTVNALTNKFNQTLVELHDLEEKYKTLLKEKEALDSSSFDFKEEVKMLTEQHQTLINELHHHEEEAKKAIEELQAIKLKETQLERVIQFLRKRSEEAHVETNQMAQDLQQAQELTKSLSDELKTSQETIRALREEIESGKSCSKELEEEDLKRREYIQELEKSFKDLKEANTDLASRYQSLEAEFKRRSEEYESLSKEHNFLKQAMLREVEDMRHQLKTKQAEFEEKISKAESLESERLAELQKKLSEKELEIQKHELRELEVQAAFETRSMALAEQDKLKEQLKKSLAENEELLADKRELEQKLKTAQQHLAKKVRESALIMERSDGDKEKVQTLTHELTQAQIKLAEVKNTIGMELEHQKKMLEREIELRKNAEQQAQRLEERYFQVHEKWIDAESEIREFKKMEEKFQELKSFFSSFNSHTAPPPPKASSKAPEEEAVLSPPISSAPQPVSESVAADLFEREAPRFKGTLF